MADLAIEYAGIEFKNPVVAVAGPLGRTFESLKRSIEAGCGAVTLKSANAKPKGQLDPKPTCHIYPKPAHAFLKKYGLSKVMINWEGVPVEFTAEKQAEMIRKIKPIAKKHGTKVIANIHPDLMYLEDEKMYRKDIQLILESGPDLLEICFCPYHLPPEATYAHLPFDSSILETMLKTFSIPKEEANVPVIAKASYKLFERLHSDFNKIGMNAFHVTEGPLFYGTVIDVDTMKPIAPGPGIITYGQHRRTQINRDSALTKALGDYKLISSSGVWNTNDTLERMMCGAHMVGLHTAIQHQGHKLFTQIIKGISDYLDKKGLKLADIIGAAVPDIISQESHDKFMYECDLTDDQIRPVIDPSKCTQCGTCANCIHGGIEIAESNPKLNLELCVRCGICESLCPTGAIVLSRD